MNTLKSIYRFLSKWWQTLHLDYRVDFTPRSSPASGAGLVEIQPFWNSNVRTLPAKLIAFFITQSSCMPFASARRVHPCLPEQQLPARLGYGGAHMFIAERRPKKYMEVGPGNSTLVAAAAKNQCSTDTEIISIDPYPRADIDQVSQRIVRRPFEQVELNG